MSKAMTSRSAGGTEALQQSRTHFIRRWGLMASYWGINRTMAEIHALMYLANRPLCTDDVMAGLQISRGNASMNLRALVEWGLLHRVHLQGDRKEYFAAEADVWQMFEAILQQRRRREVEPIFDTIQRCQDMVRPETIGRSPPNAEEIDLYRQRLASMAEFLEVMSRLFDLVLRLGPKRMHQVSKILQRISGSRRRQTASQPASGARDSG
jgi:DNA-binding transcriptional regulator GbsR (MarR family)